MHFDLHCPYSICPKIAVPFFGTIHFVRGKDYIKEIVLELFLGAVILAGDVSDFHSIVSGELDIWEKSFLAPQRNSYI